MTKNFLVIGASSGIGLELARILLADGHQVFSASRNNPNLDGVIHMDFDATAPDTTMFSTLPAELHGVVYCPGTINLKPFNRLSLLDFQTDFQIHVLGGVAVLQAVLPKLKAANGASVVMFSTVAAKVGMGFHASVAASKGAIEGLTISLAAEWAGAKIRVNSVAPSLTDTPLAKNLLSSDEKKDASNKRHPLGRYGSAAEVAKVASFLLSDDASWITGQNIGIDGGLSSLKV